MLCFGEGELTLEGGGRIKTVKGLGKGGIIGGMLQWLEACWYG